MITVEERAPVIQEVSSCENGYLDARKSSRLRMKKKTVADSEAVCFLCSHSIKFTLSTVIQIVAFITLISNHNNVLFSCSAGAR